MADDGKYISELDTFSGTPSSSDYLAINNGTTTKKIAVPSLLGNVHGQQVISFADSNSDGNVVITLL